MKSDPKTDGIVINPRGCLVRVRCLRVTPHAGIGSQGGWEAQPATTAHVSAIQMRRNDTLTARSDPEFETG